MSTTVDAAAERRVLVSTAARQRQSERWFFGGIALASILVVFVGFAPTYYLKGVFGTPPLSPLFHLHGALSTMWLLLLLLQTSLVAAGRTDIHRRMGIGAVLLIPAMLIVGPAVAIVATRRGIPNAPPALGLELLFTPLGGIVLFAILAAVGLYNRRKRDAHKRLMLVATIAILPAGLDRMVFPGGALSSLGLPVGISTFVALQAPFVLACWLYDFKTRGRIHPAFLWGGAVVLVETSLRSVIGRTAAWQAFAGWLVS